MRDRLTMATGAVLRLFALGNLLTGLAFVLAPLLSFPFEGWLVARLVAKYGPAVDSAAVLAGLRALAVVGVGSVIVVHLVLAELRAILASVGAGDPFVAVNGTRLARIGWGLLAIQTIGLVVGGFTGWFARLGVETATWTPSFGGWLGVLLAFVLAGVFRRGTEMRNDLAMTV